MKRIVLIFTIFLMLIMSACSINQVVEGETTIEGNNTESTYDLNEAIKNVKCVTEYPDTATVDDFETITFDKYEQDGDESNWKEDIEWISSEKNDDSNTYNILNINVNIKTLPEYSNDESFIKHHIDYNSYSWLILDSMERVVFGTYEQDNDMETEDRIEWLCLYKDNEKVLLISKYILDCKPYNYNNPSVTFGESYLYNWLNNDFYNKAFSETEKKLINNNEVLLYDIEKMKKYCNLEELNKMVIATFGTEYAKSIDNSSYIKNNDDVMYCLEGDYMCKDSDWFRGNNCYFVIDNNLLAGIISSHGTYYEDKEDSLGVGIRPVIWINTNAQND